jgi:hypothetical protein
MQICFSRRARSATNGRSKFFSKDMVYTRIDLKRVKNQLTDSEGDINSVSSTGVKLPKC